jgi:hypothetical protein
MTWLRTPQGVVAAHLEMLPRLQAEESLARVNEAAIGRVLKVGEWMRRQQDAWRRLVSRGRTERAKPESLAAAGIGMKVVPRG